MLNHYIINGFVEFHPAASTLRNLNDPEKVVVLNSPAGRCLLLLIKQSDQIVTQHEFMEIVWEQNGMLVTPNTFYQNVSILRKGLKKIGLEEDLVVTIPRVGLTLASGTQIQTRNSEKLVEISQEDTHYMDENFLAQDTHEEYSHEALSVSGPNESSAAVAVARLPAQTLQKSLPEKSLPEKMPHFSLWAMGIVIAILSVAGMALSSTINNTSRYFYDYPFLAKVSTCHIFIADKNMTQDDKARTLSLVEKFKSSCHDYPWIYVTHYYMLPRISIIRCSRKMDESNFCISEYYFIGLKSVDKENS